MKYYIGIGNQSLFYSNKTYSLKKKFFCFWIIFLVNIIMIQVESVACQQEQ